MRALQDDRLRCEALVGEVAAKSAELQAWLEANEWKKPQVRTPRPKRVKPVARAPMRFHSRRLEAAAGVC
jgi:hypothetical protein